MNAKNSLLTITFILALIFNLVACSNDSGGGNDSETDQNLPGLEKVNPPMGSDRVGLDQDLTLWFNVSMDKESVEQAFSVENGHEVDGEIMWNSDNTRMRFYPDELEVDTLYTVVLASTAKDKDGNKIDSKYSWSFRTIEDADDTPDEFPENPPADDDDDDDDDADDGTDLDPSNNVGEKPWVTRVEPANNATNVAANPEVRVFFSHNMERSSLIIRLLDSNGSSVNVTLEYSDIGDSGLAIVRPVNDLNQGRYTVNVSDQCESTDDLDLDEAVSFSFNVGNNADDDADDNTNDDDADDDDSDDDADTTAPTITGRSPGNENTGVSISTKIQVVFSEEIKSSDLVITVRAGSNIVGTVNYSNRVATFNPTSALPENTIITVSVTGVKDLAGNQGVDTSWTFTTAEDNGDDDADDDTSADKTFDFGNEAEVNHYTEYSGTENAAVLDRDDAKWTVPASGYHNLGFRYGLVSGHTYVFTARFLSQGDGVVTVWAGSNDDEFDQYAEDDLRFQVFAGQVHTLRYEFTSDTTDPSARIGFKCKTINTFEFYEVTIAEAE